MVDSIEQMLKKDMERELELIDFYMAYAKRINDPAIRRTLFQLIEESTFHYLRFRELSLKKGFGLVNSGADLNMIQIGELLEEGMKEEQGTREAYELQMALTSDPEITKVLSATAKDEKRHEQMLQAAHAALLKTGER